MSSRDTGSELGHKADKAGKEIQSGAHDAADKAKDVGSKAQDKASSALNQAENKTDRAAKDVKKEAKKGRQGDGELSKKDKENLKKVGAAVAVGAALIFGGVKVYRSKNHKEEPNKARAEEKAHGIAGWFGKKADETGHKLDGNDGKEKAENVADKVVASVKGAADTTKSGLDDAAKNVSGSTKGARNKVSNVGGKIEDKGLKASRDSDKAVREAYFNAADRADRVGSSGSAKAKHGKEKSGNLFDKIGGWFEDRKDDASHAAGSAKKQVQDVGNKAKK
ncbi:hypothetical protein WJX73_003861 [Symbiochloris irregularis]|uniref:Late embryogenesis abundant protein n=1 Tax=Symbiochloris irregularis TaxID=706552 RepID=A0AAW1NLP8_9CHLO